MKSQSEKAESGKEKGSVDFRFSGHETFPCRYSWLPKAYTALMEDPTLFSREDDAMVCLGVGKNMVRAIRFWAQASHISEHSTNGGYSITDLGHAIFSDNGFDPFLEDIRTLWLIHWHLSTNIVQPLFAWDFLLNRWQHPEITRSAVLTSFNKEAIRMGKEYSPVTLLQHFDVFLHTYVPTRGKKAAILEDNLDSPFVELELIQQVGHRKNEKTGSSEPIYVFRREEKSEISAELFFYCLNDFWGKHHKNEKTLTFRDISVGHGSPGQIFKLPEGAIRERLETLERDSRGAFTYKESASIQQIARSNDFAVPFLSLIYESEALINA